MADIKPVYWGDLKIGYAASKMDAEHIAVAANLDVFPGHPALGKHMVVEWPVMFRVHTRHQS